MPKYPSPIPAPGLLSLFWPLQPLFSVLTPRPPPDHVPGSLWLLTLPDLYTLLGLWGFKASSLILLHALSIVNGDPKWIFIKASLGQGLHRSSDLLSLRRSPWGTGSSRTRAHHSLCVDEEPEPPPRSHIPESLLLSSSFIHPGGFLFPLSKQINAGVFLPPEQLFPTQQIL